MGTLLNLLPLLGDLLDRVIPDQRVAAEAKVRAMEMAQAGGMAELDASMKLALAQIEVNKVEAGGDLFRAGWRPSAGWIGVGALGYEYLLRPILPWFLNACGAQVPALPSIDNQELMALLFGMLGLGAMRTVEKAKGIA